MSKYVIDSSVILAILKNEPGAEAVQYLDEGIISAVNMAEVITKLFQLGYPKNDMTNIFKLLPVSTVAFDKDSIFTSASIYEIAKKFGLSFGDRACLSLGIDKNLPVLTADRVWIKLDLPVEVKLIR